MMREASMLRAALGPSRFCWRFTSSAASTSTGATVNNATSEDTKLNKNLEAGGREERKVEKEKGSIKGALHAPPASLVEAALRPTHFRYADALIRHLKNSLVLHEPGRFIVLQKPYGISCVGHRQAGGGVFGSSVHDRKDDEEEEVEGGGRIEPLDRSPTISECLPALARHFNEPALSFFTGLKRYVSGPLLLPCSSAEVKHIKKSIQAVSSAALSPCPLEEDGEEGEDQRDFLHSALAICVGTPERGREAGVIDGYATFQPVDSHKEYIFIEGGRAKKRARTGKYAVAGGIKWRTIGQSDELGCTLLEVQCSKFARHLPRLALSHLSLPLLGDALYCRRFMDVDGRAVRVDPSSTSTQKKRRTQGFQFVPRALLDHLSLPPNALSQMPLYLHIYRTALPDYGKAQRIEDKLDLVASAPPPPHFMAMVEALGFSKTLKRFWNEKV